MSSTRDTELNFTIYDDLQAIAAEQRRELTAVKNLDTDLDLAFNLQLQEAITASLALQNLTSTSTAAPSLPPQPTTDDIVSSFADIQSDELLKLENELNDKVISETEFRKLKDDLHRRLHDRRVALEISKMPEDEWQDWGDDYERPFGEGSSQGEGDTSEIVRIYFKGLVEKQLVDGTILGGIGIALCDSNDDLLFELRKPLVVNGLNRQSAELLALIEGLNAALILDLKRVIFYCELHTTFKLVTGRWSSKQKKVSALVNKVSDLQDRFIYCQPSFVARNDIKYAFKLAREAIVSQLSRPAESSGSRNLYETCVICFEDTDISQMFSVDGCMHRYCFSCMKQHVEVKLLHGMFPTCPHEACKTELRIDNCSKFLTTRLLEIMSQRIEEASIPVTEKVYCPFPKCSALMSRREVFEFSFNAFKAAGRAGLRKCMKCDGSFCIYCKVPWHNNMTCFEYKRRNPHRELEEVRLKNLAATNLWRQCVKCNHMIELAAGCYHMTCRCGYEFCYTCGAEWRNKRATCSCPLWDEENILENEEDEDEGDDYESDYEY